MANLGNIGVEADQHGVAGIQSSPPLNRLRLWGEVFSVGISESFTEGNPATPCMAVDRPFRKRFLWPVESGTRTIQMQLKYLPDLGSGRRPKLVVKANSDIGVNADVSATAAAGANSWATIGPITVSPSSAGVLEVEMQYDNYFGAQKSFWDTVVVT